MPFTSTFFLLSLLATVSVLEVLISMVPSHLCALFAKLFCIPENEQAKDLQVPQKHAGDKISASENKERKALTTEENLKNVKHFERNERICDIGCATSMKESMLRTIRDNAEKINENYLSWNSCQCYKIC